MTNGDYHMRKWGFFAFLGLVVAVFLFHSIYNNSQLGFNKERVKTVQDAVIETIKNNDKVSVSSVGEGHRPKGGGWSITITFVSQLSESETVDLILNPLKPIIKSDIINKRSTNNSTSYLLSHNNYGVYMLYKDRYDGNWEIGITSNP